MLELLSYKLPVANNILITLWDKGSAFVWGAGKIIVAVSIVLWALASFGPSGKMNTVEEKYNHLALVSDTPAEELNAMKDAEKLEVSYAGIFGKWLEPAIKPLGFDWKIGIALITSLAAREVFVGTMSTIYSVGGDSENLAGIRAKMNKEVDAAGNPKYTMASILSLMFFYAFALQCMSTISVVKTETNSWKWAGIQFVYMTALAFFSSFAVFQLLK